MGGCDLRVRAAGYAELRARVGSGDAALELTLRRAALAEGQVVDAEGRPVDAELYRAPEGDRVLRSLFCELLEEEDARPPGSFRCEALAPGVLWLIARTADDRAGALTVLLHEGEERRDLRLVVAPPWRSQLRLRPLAAAPPRDVQFSCRASLHATWEGDVATLLFCAPPGTPVAMCVREGEVDLRRSVDLSLATAPLGDPTVVEVELPDLVPIRLAAAPAGAAAEVAFSHAPQDDRAQDGAWLLSPACAYDVAVTARGFLPLRIEGWHPPARGGALAVRLREAAAVEGVLRDVDGAPVAAAEVSVAEAGARTDALGRFRLDGLPGGAHRLVATVDWRGVAETDVWLQAGRTTDAGTLVTRPPRTLRGRVRDEAGRAVGGACVSFVSAVGAGEYTYTHANGSWAMEVSGLDGFLLLSKEGFGTTPAALAHAAGLVLPRPAWVEVTAPGAAWTCVVRWPELVPGAAWETRMSLPCTLAVAPGRVEVLRQRWSELAPEPAGKPVEARQGETVRVALDACSWERGERR